MLAKYVSMISVIACTLMASCSGKSSSNADTHASQSLALFQTTTHIDLETWYEPGAAPYSDDDWSVLSKNLTAIFQFRSRPPTITIPTELADMHPLSAQNKDTWTSSEIIALATAQTTDPLATNGARFKIIFLEGYFQDSSGTNKNVLGVSLGDSGVLAMFKKVIATTAKPLPLDKTAQLVEQVVLVHELGHAFGFVNNGVPMVSNYQDVAHGAHSTNKDCVMYWTNESSSDLTSFVGKFLGTGSQVLWGPEVLADAKAISK